VRLVREEHVPLACFGCSWGAVSFDVDSREEIASFFPLAVADLQTFVKEHQRSLFVIKHRSDLEGFYQALPEATVASTVTDAGEGRVVLLESIPNE
jgi:hypothetical protein